MACDEIFLNFVIAGNANIIPELHTAQSGNVAKALDIKDKYCEEKSYRGGFEFFDHVENFCLFS